LLYQVPIHHRDSFVITYILVLQKDDKAKRKMDKTAFSYGDNNESVATGESEEYVVSGKWVRASFS
jgi:hypothetical protein